MTLHDWLVRALEGLARGEPPPPPPGDRSPAARLAAAVRRVADSERFLSTIIENIPHMIFVKDAEELRFVKFNRAGEELLGLSRKDLLGKTDYDFFPREEADFFVAKDREVLENRALVTIPEEPIQTGNGPRVLRTKKIPILQEDGRPRYLLGISEDITEKKRVEERLRFARFAVEHAGVAVLRIGRDGRLLEVNRQACRSLGRSRDELLALTIPEIDPEFPAAAWPAKWREVKEKGSVTFETRHRTKSGLDFPVEVTADYYEFEEQECILAIARDITKRKGDEEALRKYRDSLFHKSRDGIVFFDLEGRVLEANRTALRMWGFDQVAGKRVSDLHPDGAREALGRIWRELQRHGAAEGELWCRRADGSEFLAEVSGRVLELGERPVVQGIAHDITGKRRAAEELEQTREQLRQSQKMEAIGRLAGGVAHDFNNLLTVISGYAQMIRGDLSPQSPLREDVQQVLDAADRAASLTRQLLAFSRRQVFEPVTADLNEVVAHMEKMLRRLIGENVELRIELATGLDPVLVDIGQVEQVIMNLVVNARDAMPAGGTLAIATSNRTVASPRPGLRPGRYVAAAVADTGFGMDEETRARTFEPFFTTKGEAGTGLGLSTVYGVVKQSGGYVDVESAPGGGSRFTVLLPVAEGEARAARPEREKSARVGTGQAVLVVEDEGALRAIAARALEGGGYRVLEAATAEEALVVAEEHDGSIELLLTDVVLPGMSGSELAGRLAENLPGLTIVFMSGYTSDTTVRHGVEHGTAILLRKPFTPEGLLARVADALRTPGGHVEADASA